MLTVAVHPLPDWLQRKGLLRWLSSLIALVGVSFTCFSALRRWNGYALASTAALADNNVLVVGSNNTYDFDVTTWAGYLSCWDYAVAVSLGLFVGMAWTRDGIRDRGALVCREFPVVAATHECSHPVGGAAARDCHEQQRRSAV